MDLVLDVDTGVDDALALLLAARSPGVRLLAVTCTGGNAEVDRVVVNTLTVLATAGAPSGVSTNLDRLAGPRIPTGCVVLGRRPRPGRLPRPPCRIGRG